MTTDDRRDTLSSPTPGITTRTALIDALNRAADLEHGVMCQYLYAAFSLKKTPAEGRVTWPQVERARAWQADILLVARQEMEHLGLVYNLLTSVGGTPAFRRMSFPQAARYTPALGTVDLLPFSRDAVERFMYVEKVHGLTTDNAYTDAGATIGDLYAAIKKGFEHVAATNELLFIGPRAAQVGNAAIDLRPGLYDINLLEITDLQTALRAIDQIVEAGDGLPHERADSHYRRFEAIRDELALLQQEDPSFAPARPVVSNPVTQDGRAGPATTLLRPPLTRRAATLFDAAYETMLLMLARFYTPTDETPQEREGLKKIVFFPMMTMILRPLGEMLTRMPATEDDAGPTAGPAFACGRDLPLPPHKQTAWILLHERLQALAEAGGRLADDAARTDAAWTQALHPRLSFLHDNLDAMAVNFERSMNLPQTRLRVLLGGMP